MSRRLALVSLLLALVAPTAAVAQPCVTATAACTEPVRLEGVPQHALVYRSRPLERANPTIERALVVVHGGGRNAEHMFLTGLAAAFLAGTLDTTIVIAPRFGSSQGPGCSDALARDEISWACGGWRWGSVSATTDRATSFDFLDEVLRDLARKPIFPNLRAIVVAGFSAGGQYVQRYAMANQADGTLGVPVRYVVGSPSSYAYPESNRPAPEDGTFQPFIDAQNCTTYHRWPYGMQERQGYAARVTDDDLRAHLTARPVTYLLGGLDTTPDFGFDATCPAMAQGTSRLARAQAFAALVKDKYRATQPLVIIPACGHNDRCVFTADAALPLLFPMH